MDTQIRILEDFKTKFRIAVWTPGNGMKYTVAAFRFGGSLGELGLVDDGWLVVNGFNRRAYLFQPDGLLTSRYVQEKLAPEESDEDLRRITRLVGAILGRFTNHDEADYATFIREHPQGFCPGCGHDCAYRKGEKQ